jgi:hypothetical protein
MTTAKVIEFPYSRIRLDVERHDAKILRLPEKQPDILALPYAVTLVWLSMFGF